MDNITQTPKKEYIPFSECQMLIEEADQLYVVHLPTRRTFMSQSALAILCETSRTTIIKLCSSNVTFDYPYRLQTLLDNRLINVTEIENPNKGKNFQCVDAKDSWCVLNYAANFSQGHDKRIRAKFNLAKIGEAGMSAFIYNQAGFDLTPNSNVLFQDNPKVLVGSWQEERNDGKFKRSKFTDLLRDNEYEYSKYTNKCYQVLFACTASTLKKTRALVAGSKDIARNYIEEALEIKAVSRLEQLIVENWEPTFSLTRMIVFFGHIVIAELGLNTLNRKNQVVWKEMLESKETAVNRLGMRRF